VKKVSEKRKIKITLELLNKRKLKEKKTNQNTTKTKRVAARREMIVVSLILSVALTDGV
jgi:hypothetical protein